MIINTFYHIIMKSSSWHFMGFFFLLIDWNKLLMKVVILYIIDESNLTIWNLNKILSNSLPILFWKIKNISWVIFLPYNQNLTQTTAVQNPNQKAYSFKLIKYLRQPFMRTAQQTNATATPWLNYLFFPHTYPFNDLTISVKYIETNKVVCECSWKLPLEIFNF